MENCKYLNVFSQHGQDKFYIENVLKSKKRQGYFVDLAAGDGVFISNTYLLEKVFNWKGICIEANLNTFEKLKQNRSCICDNNVILKDDEEVVFTSLANVDVFNHLESHIQGFWPQGKNNPVEKTETRKCISLNTLLDKYNAPEVIDYFSLDIEGSELAVLQDFFRNNKRRVMFWTIEQSNEDEIKELMAKNNYELVGKIVSDLQFKFKN